MAASRKTSAGTGRKKRAAAGHNPKAAKARKKKAAPSRKKTPPKSSAQKPGLARSRKPAPSRKKRRLDRTPEPDGESTAGDSDHGFVIQKHSARRLHYDFRLELDGVLKSWAVTKGPSLDPGVKRLAVHVEDHPLAYRDFEGTIPAGQYGAGTVMVWDRGTWEPHGDPHKGYAKGNLGFTLHGKRLRGRWALVRMHSRPEDGRDYWLLIKEKDAYAKPGSGDALLERAAKSALSGKTMEQLSRSGGEWTGSTSGSAKRPATKSPAWRSKLRSVARAAKRAEPAHNAAARKSKARRRSARR